MKTATEPRDDHQVTLIVEVEPEELDKGKHQAARKISQERKIPGFRPGKAPFEMVKRFAGDDVIRQQAIELLIDDVYPKALKAADLTPGAPGKLEAVSEDEPLKITFTVPLAATVDLGDYKSVRQEYHQPEVAETEIDKFIERLRTSYATYEAVTRPAVEGDMVSVNISGHLAHPDEGQSGDIVEKRPLTVLIKPDSEHPDDEWPFPGFAMELVGVTAGDERSYTHPFSEDSPYTNLRGKEVEFHVAVESIKLMNLPELTDEFAQTVGEFADLAALRENIRKGLEANAKEEYETNYFNELLEKLVQGAAIKYPPQLLDEEVDKLLGNIKQDLARQKMDLDTYLKVRNMDQSTFINTEVRPSAARQLERTLLMDEVARAEDIHPDQTDVEATFSRTMEELQQTGDIDKLRKKLPANRLANAVAMEAINRVMSRSVLNHLKGIAIGSSEVTDEATTAQDDNEVHPATGEEESSGDVTPYEE